MTTQARIDYVLKEGMEGRYWGCFQLLGAFAWMEMEMEDAIPVHLEGFDEMDLFMGHDDLGWRVVSGAVSGLLFTVNGGSWDGLSETNTPAKAIAEARRVLAPLRGDWKRLDDIIQVCIRTNGLSPRYEIAPWCREDAE